MLNAPQFIQPAEKLVTQDPLGTGAVNQTLYTSVFPGINNAVAHIRVYSAICWMVKRVHTVVYEQNLDEEEAEALFRMGLEKIELILVWYNAIRLRMSGLPGRQRTWPGNDNDTVTLSFDALPSTRARNNTGNATGYSNQARFLSPTQYGPSITNGLGFLVSEGEASYDLPEAGETLANAYGQLVATAGNKRKWFSDPRKIQAKGRFLKELTEQLRLDLPTEAERRAFLANFFPRPWERPDALDWDLRHNGLTLALRAVDVEQKDTGGAKGYVSVDYIRHAMARGCASNGTPVRLDGLEETSGIWAELQLRQFLRLALDTLLRLVELRVVDAASGRRSREIRDISNEIGELARLGTPLKNAQTVGQLGKHLKKRQGQAPSLYMAGINNKFADLRWLTTNLFNHSDQMRKRADNQRETAWLCCRALVFCTLEAENLKGRPGFSLSRRNDRLPFGRLGELVREFSDRSLWEFLAHVTWHHVINLHFSVVSERAEDDLRGHPDRPPKNRYLILPGDEGLEPVPELRTTREIAFLQDLLRSALRLLTQCGLLDEKDGKFKLTEAGRERLDESVDMEIADSEDE